MSDYYPISTDRANDAYAAALLRCQQYRFAANVRRAIAAAFDAVYCTKALEPKFAALYPDDRVIYYTASYSGDKILSVTRITATGALLKTSVRLCRKGEKRINTAELIASAEDDEKRLEHLQSLLVNFYDNLAQYNVLCNCVRSARSRIADVIYCLDNVYSF